MTTQISINPLDEQVHTRRRQLVGQVSGHPQTPITWETLPMPDWSSLRLHRRFWAEGDALELRLEVDGEPVSRSLATRDGQFLFGPTGPTWARDLSREIANEWRAEPALES